MKKKGLFLVVLCVAAVLLLRGVPWFQDDSLDLPIQFINSNQLPCTSIEIEGNSYSVEIDLGTRMAVSLHKNILENMQKEPDGNSRRMDIRGNKYETPIYLIPNIRVGKQLLKKIQTREESLDFFVNCSIGVDAQTDIQNAGRIGREFFRDKNIFMDLNNCIFIACNGPKNLKKRNYKIDNLIPIPFRSTSGGIFLDVETDMGVQRFVLDTGSTLSVIRASDYKEGVPIRQCRGLPVIETSKFVMNGIDFGRRDLCLVDISPAFDDMDGLLGMDFLKEYIVYLDFGKKMAYIGKSVKR